MDSYSSEEDQIQALKQWWERNGSSVLVGIGLALAIVFGGQWWQQRHQAGNEQVAMLYQQLLQAVENSADDEVQRANARHLGGELLKIKAASRLADQTRLLLARIAVEQGEMADAAGYLDAVLEHNPDVSQGALMARLYGLLGRAPDSRLGALARVRLARVQFASGKPAEALATLDAARSDDFRREREELRGDILFQGDDHAAALKAYRAAATGIRAAPLLSMKLRELELELEPDGAAPTEEPVAAQQTVPNDTGVQP